MQKFKFPMEYLRVTQGEYSSYSHAGSLAMDFGGKDTGADKLYCPCDMVVKRCRHNANGELYLESTLPVRFADGTTDYARILCIHDSQFNVTEGAILKQGDYFYDEGGMGSGNPKAFGTHCHIEAGKGKWKSCTQSKNSAGTYVIENQSHLYDLFILGDDVQILDGGGYNWKTVSDIGNEKVQQPAGTILAADFSKHQQKIDWKEIEDRGIIKAVGLRTGYGDKVEGAEDEQFKANMQGAIALNLPIWHYHFIYSKNVEEAITEANFMADLLEPYRDKITGIVFWDYEYDAMRYLQEHYGFTSPKEQVQANCLAFCNRLRELGYTPGIYTNKDLFYRFYSDEFITNNGLMLWLADPNNPTPWHACDIWQYEVSNGAEWGINKDIDKDIVFINLDMYKPLDRTTVCESCAKVANLHTDLLQAQWENSEQAAEIEKLKAENETLKQEKTELDKALKQLNILYQSTRNKYVELLEIHEQLEENYLTAIDENTALITENQTLKSKQTTNIFTRIFDILFGKGDSDK